MLKFIFLCLLIANSLLFAMWQGYLSNPVVTSHQPQRLLQQQNSQYLKLVSAQVATSPALSCLELGPFTENELIKIEAKLTPLKFDNRQARQSTQESTSTLVFIPSLKSKEAAEKKVTELKELGINDFYIIQDHTKLRWGISLGVFKSEEMAKQLLATLASKGVRNVKTKVRTSAVAKFTYVFTDINSAEKLSLENLKKEFPAQNLGGCK